jgi:aldose sugar dehydrogenase
MKKLLIICLSLGLITCKSDSVINNTTTPLPTPTNPDPIAMAPTTVVDGIKTRSIIENLDVPWEILWGPDSWLWITERKGLVSRINPESGEKRVILTLTDVTQPGEAGLLGMAFHPDFAANQHLYLVYTYSQNNQILEKVVRYTYQNGELRNPNVILNNIPGNSTHIGSRLLISADRKLLVTTGDAQNQASSMDLKALTGKILRLNLDGSVPADNPFPNSYVYSYGLRNTQGLVQLPNGTIYGSEHGPTTDDELNIIEKGGNYGWNRVLGPIDAPEREFAEQNSIIPSVAHWTPTIAPSDLIFYTGNLMPSFKNKLLLTTLKNKNLIAMSISANGKQVTDSKIFFNNAWGRLRDICVAPDGRIFIATNGASWSNVDGGTHKIYELSGE